jgi:ribonuclease III
MFRTRKYKDLEKKLGYKFKSQDLLERSLTHASLRGAKKAREDNERLEFIGDRVLGLAIVESLHQAFPNADEGELARRYNRLVKGETCAKVGGELGLGDFMILSESEAESGGRAKPTILADGIEAVLGAIFLDGGFEKARDVVLRLWESHDRESLPRAAADSKSALQEWAQGKGLALPRYTEIERKGPDHAPLFTSEVSIKDRKPARGSGTSKRTAEQAAASAFLAREGMLEKGSYD